MKNKYCKTAFSSLWLVVVSFAPFCIDVCLAHDWNAADLIRSTGSVPLKLTVFDCGNVIVRDSALLNLSIEKGEEKHLTNSCYLIEHSDGTLFWDTGLPDSIAGLSDGKDVRKGMLHLSLSKTLLLQLSESAIDPSQITYLAASHLHDDHVGNVAYFPAARWLVQAVEYDVAFGEKAHERGFHPDVYKTLENNPVELLHGNHDVFGDGSVVILFMPGHTEGHQVLYVDLPQTGPIVLSGDLYHFTRNREIYGIPVINFSKKQTIRSFASLDEILELSGAQLWIQHDKEQNETIRHAPEYYD
jgi:glyoxylase-like metal-dependent hydrolase (beta-lactamase superfamily II)